MGTVASDPRAPPSCRVRFTCHARRACRSVRTTAVTTGGGVGGAEQRRQNLNSGSTAMAHENLARSVLGKGLCMGTSCRLHQATVMRGSL